VPANSATCAARDGPRRSRGHVRSGGGRALPGPFGSPAAALAAHGTRAEGGGVNRVRPERVAPATVGHPARRAAAAEGAPFAREALEWTRGARGVVFLRLRAVAGWRVARRAGDALARLLAAAPAAEAAAAQEREKWYHHDTLWHGVAQRVSGEHTVRRWRCA
jgi:hypothetical protein